MSNSKNNEKEFIENSLYVTVAILAASIAIMSNFLQVNNASDFLNIRIAVTIFSITIPYLVWDVYFLNIESVDEEFEPTYLTVLRVLFWLAGAIGIAFSFGTLKNTSSFSTTGIFLSTFIVFFIFRFAPVFYHFFKKRRGEKK